MHGQLMYPIDVFHFVQEKFKIAWNENEINLFFSEECSSVKMSVGK